MVPEADRTAEDTGKRAEDNEKTTIKKIKVPVYLIETEFKKYLKYEGIFKGIDLNNSFYQVDYTLNNYL